ncbi:MAG: HEAT repeat domain-containing protein, partial [Planctomycetota bacterium]
EILERQELSDFHTNAIIMLGYIGSDADVKKFEGIVGNFSGNLDDVERIRLARLLDALGIMFRRGIATAGHLLDAMMNYDYWDHKSLKWYDEGGKAVTTDADVFMRLVVNGYALSREPGIDERIAKVLTQIHDKERRKSMEYLLASRKIQSVRDDFDRAEREPVPNELRVRLGHAWNRDHQNPLPAIPASPERKAAEVHEQNRVGAELERSPNSVLSSVEAGDSSVVTVLRVWLNEKSTNGSDPLPLKLSIALDGLAAFGDRASLPNLRQLYQNRDCSPVLRSKAAIGIIKMSSVEDVELLLQIMWDQSLALNARCESAKTLWQLNDASGGEFLLGQYDLYRLETRSRSVQYMAGVRSTLATIYDPKLIEELLRRIPTEPDQKMKNNITTLVTRMRMNNEPIDRLKEFAADPSWKNAGKRYEAIEVLGQQGTPELIPFLESLGPFDGENVPNGQSRMFREEANKAIGSIRRRHWKDE